MTKFYFRLMTKGLQRVVTVLGEQHSLPKGKEWHVPYYSKEKYVVAKDEDVARHQIRAMMKHKWTGFRLTRKEDIK